VNKIQDGKKKLFHKIVDLDGCKTLGRVPAGTLRFGI